MDKQFFSSDNKSRLLCLLKSNNIGATLNTNDLLDIVIPQMNYVYQNSNYNDTLTDLNTSVVRNLKSKTVRQAPESIVVRRDQKLSQQDIQKFLGARDQFDMSIGLKPMLRTSTIKPKEENVNIEPKYEDSLDAFFELQI